MLPVDSAVNLKEGNCENNCKVLEQRRFCKNSRSALLFFVSPSHGCSMQEIWFVNFSRAVAAVTLSDREIKSRIYVNITVNFSIAFAHFLLVHKTTKAMKKQRL